MESSNEISIQTQGAVCQYYSPINKHYFLQEDKQWIRIVCSVEVLIIPLLIKASVPLKPRVCVVCMKRI